MAMFTGYSGGKPSEIRGKVAGKITEWTRVREVRSLTAALLTDGPWERFPYLCVAVKHLYLIMFTLFQPRL